MNAIDVSGLSEQELQVIQNMVDLLRQKSIEENKSSWSDLAQNSFALDWDNEKDDIYNNWQEQYSVRKG